LALVALMPVLFAIGASFVNLLYPFVPAGETILQDIRARHALSLTMLAGIAAGILAFVMGAVAITRKHERAVLVYAATAVGCLLLLFLAGEFLLPE
jgi:hypothetical protein